MPRENEPIREPEGKASQGTGNSDRRYKWTDILDVTSKLIGALAIVFAGFVASRFQSSMATSNLLVQREQSDSALRASMFHDLIGPFTGSGNSRQDISIEREQLLVELLALNFSDHFELKPLMVHLDDRLWYDKTDKMNQALRETTRQSLRSTAQQVVQRQVASLSKVDKKSASDQLASFSNFELYEGNPKDCASEESKAEVTPSKSTCPRSYFNELFSLKSPNGLYNLAITIGPPANWDNQRYPVTIVICSMNPIINQSTQGSDDCNQMAVKEFLLTWFDFPFSNYTLLADGTRFSLLIDQVEPYVKRARFKLVWFPQDYIATQERPINYSQFREQLGIEIKH